jgi:uncharacterized protein
MKKILPLIVSLMVSPLLLTAADAPKKLLVVTVTAGYRHSSIPTGERIVAQLGKETGEFTVDFLQQPEIGKAPAPPKKPTELKADATEAQQAAFKAAQEKFVADTPAYEAAQAKWAEQLRPALMKLSPDSLKNYDGVVFISTTGDLPIPDRDGFLAWIKSGKAFIGIHGASDTFHGWKEFAEMLGAEFDHHDAQLGVDLLNADPAHPATAHLPKVWPIAQEEVYQFNLYDPAKVHELLYLDKKPDPKNRQAGHYPIAWCQEYGKGKVFYTALGHREDIWDADPNIKDRKNSVELSKAFQAHILGGIEWALGLKPGDAKPQAK